MHPRVVPEFLAVVLVSGETQNGFVEPVDIVGEDPGVVVDDRLLRSAGVAKRDGRSAVQCGLDDRQSPALFELGEGHDPACGQKSMLLIAIDESVHVHAIRDLTCLSVGADVVEPVTVAHDV